MARPIPPTAPVTRATRSFKIVPIYNDSYGSHGLDSVRERVASGRDNCVHGLLVHISGIFPRGAGQGVLIVVECAFCRVRRALEERVSVAVKGAHELPRPLDER